MPPSQSEPGSQTNTLPWWISPTGLHIGFLIPIFLLVTYVGHSHIPGLLLRGIWFFTTKYVLLGLGLLVVTSVSCWIGTRIGAPRKLSTTEDMIGWVPAALVTGVIALAAYVYFFRPLLLDPILLLHTLTGAYRPDRDNMEETAGITSFENFGPVFFSIYAYVVVSRKVKVGRFMHVMCAVMMVLTALRVYVWSERLALIEAVLPFGLAGAARLGAVRKPWVRGLTAGGPFFAIPLLIGYFGLAESVRSWTASVYHGHSSFWEFAIGRIASYYVTSLNNGAGLLQTSNGPNFSLEHTAAWLHRIPLFGETFSAYLDPGGDPTAVPFDVYLDKFGDPEFNNPSGIFSVIYDLGMPLGIVYFAIAGIFAGMLYRGYRQGTFAGILLYPMLFLTFLEVFRYPYLGGQRAFTWALGILVALLVGSRRGTQAVTVNA